MGPDLVCKRISSAGRCKKKLKYSRTLWSQVCALTCGDKELCPTNEENPGTSGTECKDRIFTYSIKTGNNLCRDLKEHGEKRICDPAVDKDRCAFCQGWKGQYLCPKTCVITKYCEDPNPK